MTKDERYRARCLLFTPFREAENYHSDDSRSEGGRSGRGTVMACYDVTLDDMAKAVRECGMYMYAVAGITVAYAIGRDVCHWTLSQSDFERKMRMMGYDCKDGTIANTFRNNPYMREHVSKWAVFGAKSEVLKLRAELQKSLIGMKENTDKT